MVTLNKPSAGDTDWTTEVNDNWTELESAVFMDGLVSGEIKSQSPVALGVRTVSLKVALDGTVTSISDQNLTVTTAHATNPRVDLVQWNGATISVKAGTAAATPDCPSPDSGYVPLCAILVPATATLVRDLDAQAATTEGCIIAYYYARGGLYASRIGVTDTPGTSSTSFQDANEMFLPVYIPRVGAGYEWGWESEVRANTSGTNSRAGINLSYDGTDETTAIQERRAYLAPSGLEDQPQFLQSVMVKGAVTAGAHRLKGRYRETSGSGVTITLMNKKRRIWIQELH